MREERRRYEDSWHLDKRLNIGHVLTTMSLLGAIVMIWSNTNDRITRLEVQQNNTQRVSEEIKQELKSMNSKMDKLVERVLTNGNR